MSFLNELQRRNVFRVATAYLVSSWLLIQISETIFPLFGFGDTPARLVVIVLSIGFIPSLIFSWVFEITPEGLKKDRDVVREHSISHVTGKKLDRIILAVLALALTYFAFDKFVLVPARVAEIVEETTQQVRSAALIESYGDLSIAVLPFINMSDDASNEYFSDGVSEELLNLLSKIPQLRVISRSSAYTYKNKDIDIPTIGERLGVAHILEGSVRRDGDRVRVTAQLIDARSDTHLWSDAYDREVGSIFKIQDEISAAIVGALKERLGLELEVAPQVIAPVNTEAHDAYLRGRFLVVQRTQSTIEGAVQEFEKAIALDPGYALAHAELAIATILLWTEYYGDLSLAKVLARAIPHAERAIALDANLAEAQAAKGLIFRSQGEYEKALTNIENAIRLNPNYSIVYSWRGNLLNSLGRYYEAMKAHEKALILDPLSALAIGNCVEFLIDRNKFNEAEEELEKIASIYPGLYANLRGDLMSVGGKWASLALGTLDALQIDQRYQWLKNELAIEFAVIGLEQEALAISDEILPKLLLMLGRPSDAVTVAEARFNENPTNIYARWDLGLALAFEGDYARARSILEDMWQWSSGRVTDASDGFQLGHAAALIAILRSGGEEAKTAELLTAIEDDVRRCHEAGIATNSWSSVDFEEGIAAYINGERERGITLIAKGSEAGFLIPPKAAYYQTLYDDPDFAPIIAAQRARQAQERARLLSLVCTDNPYKQVWQPAATTCERFAEAETN